VESRVTSRGNPAINDSRVNEVRIIGPAKLYSLTILLSLRCW